MGTVILTVTATDADSGDYALIEYSLGDGEGTFAINPTTVSERRGPGLWRGLHGGPQLSPCRRALPLGVSSQGSKLSLECQASCRLAFLCWHMWKKVARGFRNHPSWVKDFGDVSSPEKEA